jgi:C-terminal processing protease CtpA/Prc
LPNGWTFGLPNELFRSKTGKSFDGAGVAPDIRAPVFPKVDLEGGRDSALEKALEALGKR